MKCSRCGKFKSLLCDNPLRKAELRSLCPLCWEDWKAVNWKPHKNAHLRKPAIRKRKPNG